MNKLGFSVAEFCSLHGISRPFFYTLVKRGQAPEIMKLGTRTIISVEAATRWREKMERHLPTGTETKSA